MAFAILLANDTLALMGVFLAGYFIRDKVLSSLTVFSVPPVPLAVQFRSGFLMAVVIMLLIFTHQKLYARRFSFWEETRLLIEGVTLTFLLVLTVVFIFRLYSQFSRTVIVITWLLSLIVFPLSRRLVKNVMRHIGLWQKNILVLGTGTAAQRISREIRRDDNLGYVITGFVSEESGKSAGRLVEGIPVVGVIQDLKRLIAEGNIRDVVIALPGKNQVKALGIIKSCEQLLENLQIMPTLGSEFAFGIRVHEIGDVLTLSFPRNLTKPWNILIKRSFELGLCLALLLPALPLFLLIGAALKFDSRGPVLFVQKRIGRYGKEFKLIKFRSMHQDAESRLKRYLGAHPKACREWKKYQKLRGFDPRVTRVGKILRAWSLDELPQLFNVLLGNMNLVGPRPYLPREKRRIGRMSGIIHRVKPGLTGLWQVKGRSQLPFDERLTLDEFYIRNWSLWLDIVILLQSFRILARREGAF